MYTEILRGIEGVGIFPIISLVLFVAVFTVVLGWALRADRGQSVAHSRCYAARSEAKRLHPESRTGCFDLGHRDFPNAAAGRARALRVPCVLCPLAMHRN